MTNFEKIGKINNYESNENESIINSIKIFKSTFINEFIFEIVKTNLHEDVTLETIFSKIEDITGKIFLSDFIDMDTAAEGYSPIIELTHNIIRYFHKEEFYNYKTDTLINDENKLVELRKFESIREIYENINFNLLTNEEYLAHNHLNPLKPPNPPTQR